MAAKMRIGRWDSSLGVRIPKAIAEQWGVSEGAAEEMESGDGQVTMRKQTYTLADMPSRVTVENLHLEQEIGDSQGKEEW